MNLEKITTTIYDILGYVIPGFIVLFAFCIADASFVHSHSLCLQRLSKHPVFTTVLAYVSGLVCHVIAAWLKTQFPRHFDSSKNRISERISARVHAELHEFYSIPKSEEQNLSTLETYQLSEAYSSVSGGFADREVYMAHEGFSKSAMVSTFFLGIIAFATVFMGGTVIQIGTSPITYVHFNWWGTLVGSLGILGITILFKKRFLFFNRLKNNYTLLAFLARRLKDKAAVPVVSGVATAPVNLSTHELIETLT